MQKFSKKFLAILLTLCMIASFAPLGVFAAEASAQVIEQQLMLGDDLTMHFHVKTEAANATATISVEGNERAVYTLSELTPGENGYDLFVHLAAAEMTAQIKLAVNDGTSDILTKDYSVQEYAHYLLENNYTDETKALVKAMLDYGTKAQLYFDYKTDALANAGYEIETQTAISKEVPKVTASGSLSGISYYGSTMVFRSQIAIRHYFTAENGIDGYRFTVNGATYPVKEKGGLYYIEVSDINPHQMDAEMAVSVTDSTGSLSFNYSPMAYIIRMYNKESSSAKLKAMLLAANGYFEAAKVFTGVAENRTGSLNFGYRYGANNLIQVNTNLPSDTPVKDFLTTDNGCSIDESANQYKNVSYISMTNVNGTIVLTFNFGSAFEAGQTYFLPKGAVFGFTDNSKYTLDKNYTFTYDGSSWTMEASEPAVDLTCRYGTNKLIQYNTNLPATTALKDFLATDNGCQITQSGDQQVGYVSMLNADGTIVLTFNFNAEFEAGQSYTLSAGSLFGFTDGSKYELAEDITLYWTGSEWSAEAPVVETPALNFLACSYGTSTLIQLKTDLPGSTPCASFTAGDNGCDLKQDANKYQQVGWIGMAQDDAGNIYLAFNFNGAFEAGQTYVLPKGAVFGFTDGSKYVLDKNYTFTFNGNSWDISTPEDPITIAYRWGNNNTIQYNTNLPTETPCANFLAGDNGCALIQNGQQVGWVGMDNVDGTIVLTFHFNGTFEVGQSYTLSTGSVFGFTDGSLYELYESITLYWDGSNWTTAEPGPQADVLDAENFTGGQVITFADLPVDSKNPAKIEEYKALGFNTSLLTEDHTGAKGPDKAYQVESSNMTHFTGDLHFEFHFGTSKLIQIKTNLPADTPLADFGAGDNGCSIDQSGNQYQQVGWIQMNGLVDGAQLLTFHFNGEFQVGQTYVLPAGAVFGFKDGNRYTLDADYTFTFEGNYWSVSRTYPLTLSQNAGAGKYIQLKTNIPTGLTYGNFLLGQNGHNIILETTEGAQAVGWFQYGELEGTVYLVLHLNGYNKPGTQYILKAGTTLIAGDRSYVLAEDFTMTVKNDYLTSLENIDNAGLNVWIRNYHNTEDYFTGDLTAALKLYQDTIDGFYMVDEMFQTEALKTASGQSATSDFTAMTAVRDWFNLNFADKYFHSNHVPMNSWDHYTSVNGDTLSGIDVAGYRNFLASYKASFNDQLTSASGASISFDNYPFVHEQGKYGGFFGFGGTFESGIQDTYLLNCLIAAQVAGEDDFGLCVQTFHATDLKNKTSRDITSAAEVSLQLYTGFAMGADVFEYFAYNSNEAFSAIMNQDGSKRIYDLVQEGNQALCFADVVNSFAWNGIVTSAGSVNSHNGDAFTSVAELVLADGDNGVLASCSSTDDAIIGCFTKDSLNGYMLVNYNDPAAVTGNNTVKLTFADCTRARVYTEVDGVLISQIVDLTNGSYTVTLAPGAGCFIIPA